MGRRVSQVSLQNVASNKRQTRGSEGLAVHSDGNFLYVGFWIFSISLGTD